MSRSVLSPPAALSKWTARLQETIVGPAKEAGAIESPGQQMSAGGMSLPLSRTIGQAYLGAGSSRSLRLGGQSHHRPADSPRAVSGAGPGALQPPPAYLLGSPLSEPFLKAGVGEWRGAGHHGQEQREPHSVRGNVLLQDLLPGPSQLLPMAPGPPSLHFAPLRSKGRGPGSETACDGPPHKTHLPARELSGTELHVRRGLQWLLLPGSPLCHVPISTKVAASRAWHCPVGTTVSSVPFTLTCDLH